MEDHEKSKPMGQVIQIDKARIRDHLGEMARGTVEEALNAMLDAEADRLCGTGRYERAEGRKDMGASSYEGSLETKAGPVRLKMPKLRRQAFETAIIERYQRRESSVEEALMWEAKHFCGWYNARSPTEGFADLSVPDIDAYMDMQAPGLTRKSLKDVAERVRGVLKYLYRTSHTPTSLAPHVIAPLPYAYLGIRSALTPEQIAAVLETAV